MIPGTDTLEPLFIADSPDWAESVELVLGWDTTITPSRNGSEQRSRNRFYPKTKISFVVSALSVAEYASRRSRARAEVKSPVVVPLWPIQYNYVSKAGQVITVDQLALGTDNLLADEYIFILEAGVAPKFYRIDSTSGSTITVSGSILAYTTAAKVFPCLLGVRDSKTVFKASTNDSVDEIFNIEGL